MCVCVCVTLIIYFGLIGADTDSNIAGTLHLTDITESDLDSFEVLCLLTINLVRFYIDLFYLHFLQNRF